ncbi:hypothetical protein ACJ41O_006943 [Fusarium nematophilum]
MQVSSEVHRITSLGVDAVICTSGCISAYQQAARCVRNAGTIICIGVNPENLPVSPLDMVRRGLRLVGSAVGTRAEMQELFQLAVRGEVKPLVTVAPFSQIDSMARELEGGRVMGRIVMPIPHSSIDPLWLIDKQEALRLYDVYGEEIGISYPFLPVQALVDKAHTLYDAMEAGSRNGFAFSSLPGPTVIDGDDLDILRLAMSTALTIETSAGDDNGQDLAPDITQAIHAFLSGDGLQAWRLIGIPARWCLELGLHQATTYSTKFKQASEMKMAIGLFWSIHTLDRRWSFGAGLPFVIQSNDIDLNLPMLDSEVPYHQAMVAYNRIGAKVWATLCNSSSTASTDEVDFLHYSVDRRSLHRLRILLYLRACQMRILLHQSVLHSVSRFTADASQVRLLVNIAKDMIQTLDNLNKTTDIYQTQQVCFNHFLISALGVVFLAVALEPAVYRGVVHSEFNMALDLVRGFSTRSYVSPRLWRMIRGLRQAGVRLGITNQQLEEGIMVQQPPNTAHADGIPSPPLLASPESQSGPSLAGEAWLGGEMAGDRGDGFMMPLSGLQMTLTLNDLLAAMESENGSWEDLGPGGEALEGVQDKDIEGSFDHRGGFSKD